MPETNVEATSVPIIIEFSHRTLFAHRRSISLPEYFQEHVINYNKALQGAQIIILKRENIYTCFLGRNPMPCVEPTLAASIGTMAEAQAQEH